MVRLEQLQVWLKKNLTDFSWPPKKLAGDASFRCYYRVDSAGKSYVVMDAPPEKESCDAFVAIDRAFHAHGLSVPKIYADDLENGFLLLSDFGDTLYLDALNDQTVDGLYGRAISDIFRIHECNQFNHFQLPVFSDAMYQHEYNLFFDWFLNAEKKAGLSEKNKHEIFQPYSRLVTEIKAQPQVCVHRDYHSRNLMVLPDNGVGILDFQDAVLGPVTYDLLSLIRDCYIDWPQHKVREWLDRYHRELLSRKTISETSFERFEQWFDYASAQRHLKCVGIFTRLEHLFKRPGYLQYLPRTLNYLREVCDKHALLAPFREFIQ